MPFGRCKAIRTIAEERERLATGGWEYAAYTLSVRGAELIPHMCSTMAFAGLTVVLARSSVPANDQGPLAAEEPSLN